MIDNIASVDAPCGCRRIFGKRMAPDIDENGHPRFGDDGAFLMKEVEDIQETYCPEHSKVLIERQQSAIHALESGASPDDAIALLTGTAVPALTDGNK